MIKKALRSLKRRTRKRVADATWNHLMEPARAGWGRKPFDQEELKLLRAALVSQNLCCINGQMVPAFEAAFAAAHDVPFAVASTSGTAAIHVALGALDLEPGDEIITAPITDLGTVIPILSQGCIPVFADIDDTYNIDPEDVQRKVTSLTRAILAVHLFGNPCDMDALREIAAEHHLVLIEDCSQAHFAEYRGRRVGTIGDIGCFSFQQSKHMTTGDGGMTITSNREYFERMKLFADKGFARKGYGPRAYLFHAPNYRMTELVGAVGLAQLRKLPDVVARRRDLGRHMTERLAHIPDLITVPTTLGATHSFWTYPIRMRKAVDMTALSRTLAADGVNAMVGYTGKPIYLCSESLAKKKTYGTSEWPFTCAPDGVVYEYKEGLCPRAEKTLEHLICLPFDESWSHADVDRVAGAVARALAAPSGTPRHATEPATVKPQPVASTDAPPPLRIGIVGCGQMGRWHFDAYKKNPRVELVAFADSHLPSAEAFAARVGGRAYASHREMLAHEQLDGVSVCTMPSTHREIAVDVIRYGAHVLCEKPLASSLDDATAMCHQAKESGRLLLAGFKFRFFEEVDKARALLQSNALGPLVTARLMFGAQLDMTGTWYARPELSGGGVLMDNGPHAFDLIRYLFGDIVSVGATLSAHHLDHVEDTAHVTCELGRGGLVTVDLSWTLGIPGAHYLEIYGEQGTAFLDADGISYKLQTWPEWKRVPNTRNVHDAFARQIDHFVAAADGEPPVVVQMADGREAQRLIAAAYQAASQGQSIIVAEDESRVYRMGYSHEQIEPAHAG